MIVGVVYGSTGILFSAPKEDRRLIAATALDNASWRRCVFCMRRIV